MENVGYKGNFFFCKFLVFVQCLIRFVVVEEDVVYLEVLFVFGQFVESDNAEMF